MISTHYVHYLRTHMPYILRLGLLRYTQSLFLDEPLLPDKLVERLLFLTREGFKGFITLQTDRSHFLEGFVRTIWCVYNNL